METQQDAPPKKIPDADDALPTKTDEASERKRPKWKNILHRTEQLRSTFQDLKGKLSSKSAYLPKFRGISSTDEEGAEKQDLEKGTVKNTGSVINSHSAFTLDEHKANNSDSTGMEVTTAKIEKGIQVAEVEKSLEAESDIEDSWEAKIPREKELDPPLNLAISPDQTQPISDEKSNPPNDENQSILTPSFATVDQSIPGELDGGTKTVDPAATTATAAAGHGPQSKQNLKVPPRRATFRGKDRLANIPEESQSKTEDLSRGTGPSSEQDPRQEPRKARLSLGQLDEILIKAYSLPNNLGEPPPLQPRRTLAQYFYTHLSNTYHRDTDQVVLRWGLFSYQFVIFS